jgi:hypothetical protein
LSVFSIKTESGLNLTDEEEYAILQESYDINENDTLATNDELELEAESLLDFSERDPFSEGTY